MIPMSRGGFRQTKKMRCNVWLWEGGGVCGGTVGSYRTLSEHSEWITRPQAAPNKNSQSQDWPFLFGADGGTRTHMVSRTILSRFKGVAEKFCAERKNSSFLKFLQF